MEITNFVRFEPSFFQWVMQFGFTRMIAYVEPIAWDNSLEAEVQEQEQKIQVLEADMVQLGPHQVRMTHTAGTVPPGP